MWFVIFFFLFFFSLPYLCIDSIPRLFKRACFKSKGLFLKVGGAVVTATAAQQDAIRFWQNVQGNIMSPQAAFYQLQTAKTMQVGAYIKFYIGGGGGGGCGGVL